MELDDEVDPLDAFMNQNDTHVTALIKQAQEKAEEVEEEIDPLDAFMAAEVLPAVTQNGLNKTPQAQVRCLPLHSLMLPMPLTLHVCMDPNCLVGEAKVFSTCSCGLQ